jgi:hypothetical protein
VARRPPSTADLIRYLMDQHGLTRADMVPILGTPSRVTEILRGRKGLSMAMVQRLRARFRAGRFAPSAAEESFAASSRQAGGGMSCEVTVVHRARWPLPERAQAVMLPSL